MTEWALHITGQSPHHTLMLVISKYAEFLAGGHPMNAVVLEHVPVNELPAAWRAKLVSAPGDLVTVRIEAEAPNPTQNHSDQSSLADNPLVGMWRDRDDMADVGGYIRKLRASRFNDDGTANPA